LDDEPMRAEKPAVFVFGRTINALAIIRSIGSRGVRTVMVDSHPDEIAFYSRFCDQKVRIHEMSEDPELVLHELIDAAGKQDQRPVLLCTRDEYLVFLSKYQTILQDHFIFSLPEPDMVSTIIDKRLLAQFALQRGIPIPGPTLSAQAKRRRSSVRTFVIQSSSSPRHRIKQGKNRNGWARNCS